jgi:protein-disulfide isomerase
VGREALRIGAFGTVAQKGAAATLLPTMTTASQRRARKTRRPDPVLPRHRRPEPAPPSRWRGFVGLPLISAIAAIGGALLIAVAVVTGSRAVPSAAPASQNAPVAGHFAGLPTNGYVLGRATAPVTIDLYEDFQCPACRRWGESIFPTLAANELASGEAKLVFHNFPFIGPESMIAARAAHAAVRQGQFWDLWHALYANQGPENAGTITTVGITDVAAGLGMDRARFSADMASSGAGMAIDASVADAHRLNVDSTPTLVVNGQKMVGASYAELAATIANAASN